jgi:hypothetical protein
MATFNLTHCKIVPLVNLISIHDFGADLKFNMATKDGIWFAEPLNCIIQKLISGVDEVH